jgi:Rho GDP-dissociation inhibitor
LELASPTLPPGKRLVFDLGDPAQVAGLKNSPVIIKEGVEYK